MQPVSRIVAILCPKEINYHNIFSPELIYIYIYHRILNNPNACLS